MTGKAGSFFLVFCLLSGLTAKLQSKAVLVGHSNVFNLRTFTEEEKSESNSFQLIEETNIFSLNTKPVEDLHDPKHSNSLFTLVFETEIFGLNTHPKDSGPPPNGTKRIGGTLTIVHETETFPLSTHPIFRPLVKTLSPKEMENGNILL